VKRRPVGVLTKVRALAYSRPPGALDLATFVELHKAKELPAHAALDRLAVAFERMVVDGIDPATALNMRPPGPGRPRESSHSETYSRKLLVAEFILDALERDKKKGRRVGRAIEKAAKKFRKSQGRVLQVWGEVGRRARMDRESFRAEERAGRVTPGKYVLRSGKILVK
jgi:hypothetical protein